ncbi:MAG: VOC family protein [Actinomycetota bacterium]|nr:VOC family protein [Actinomycetota bacterium]
MTLDVGMVTIDCENPQRLAAFWSAALGMQVLGDYGEFVLLGRAGSPVHVGLQRVPEPRAGKNRVHIDLRGEPRRAAAERLEQLGATIKEEHRQPGLDWIVLSDPEGNEFCLGEPSS